MLMWVNMLFAIDFRLLVSNNRNTKLEDLRLLDFASMLSTGLIW